MSSLSAVGLQQRLAGDLLVHRVGGASQPQLTSLARGMQCELLEPRICRNPIAEGSKPITTSPAWQKSMPESERVILKHPGLG